jgi:predicted metal-dependent hydrolase
VEGTPGVNALSDAPDQSDKADEVAALTLAVAEWRCRFNAGDYFGAHEIAEDAWHLYRGPLRDFLKGLVQISVSLHHHFARNRHGASAKWGSSRAYLRKYEPTCLGLDVGHLLSEVCRFYEAESPGEPKEGTARPHLP